MKQREILHVTRKADLIAKDRSEMIVDMLAHQVKELVECTISSIVLDEIGQGILKGLSGFHRYLKSEFINNLHTAFGEYAKVAKDFRKASAEIAGRMYIAGDTCELTPTQIATKLGRA